MSVTRFLRHPDLFLSLHFRSLRFCILHNVLCSLPNLLQAEGFKSELRQDGVDDLVLLPKVTEEGIVHNLLVRYQRDKIYV